MPMPKTDNTSTRNTSYCGALKAVSIKFGKESQSSQRVYNVVSAYDGIDVRFLEALPDGNRTDVRTALRKSAGEVHFDRCGKLPRGTRCPDAVNAYVENVGVSEEKVTPWKPATFLHWVPTLILEGKGDPVTAGDQAEEIFTEALRGPRTLIRFPGIGHNMMLPSVKTRPVEREGPCASDLGVDLKFSYRTVRDCLIDEFLKTESDDFANALILIEIKPIAEVLPLPQAKRDPSPTM
jgi:hypothetical protein